MGTLYSLLNFSVNPKLLSKRKVDAFIKRKKQHRETEKHPEWGSLTLEWKLHVSRSTSTARLSTPPSPKHGFHLKAGSWSQNGDLSSSHLGIT